MHQTLSEFMGCESWEKAELCAFIDKQHEELKARDELLKELYNLAAMNEFDVGEEFRFHEILTEMGIEV